MTLKKKKIIACQIFSDELLAALPEENRGIDITWLDPGLHMNLGELESALKQALNAAAAEEADARVLFGHGCHPDMCQIVDYNGGKTLGAKNCVHAFCGDRLDELEQNRTMVMTPGWIRFFPSLMAAAGWDEVDVRQNLGRYDRILVMDPGINPLSEDEILEFYDLTQVPIEIQPIDLDHFRAKLIESLR